MASIADVAGDSTAVSSVYDAFISYGSNDSQVLARSLYRALLRLAKPWYKFRIQRIFLDKAELPASSDLRGAIEQALASSRWLILLASPAAAQSRWVNREVSWWLDNGRASHLIIATTSPEVRWDEDAGGWAGPGQVPPALRTSLRREPRIVYLTEAVNGNPRTLPTDQVAQIAAPIRGVPKSRLVGDDLRERRRTSRLVTAAVSSLVILTAAAVTSSLIAIGQRDHALALAKVALSRQLAATSESELTTNLRIALLLAAQAYATNANDQTYSALMRADLSTPELVRSVQADSAVTKMVASGNGQIVAAGLANGGVLRWSFAAPHPRAILTLPGPISSLAISNSGSTVAASDGTHTLVWHAGHEPLTLSTPSGQAVRALALSPSGRTAVLGSAPPPQRTRMAAAIVVQRTTRNCPDGAGRFSVSLRSRIRRCVVRPPTHVRGRGDGRLAAANPAWLASARGRSPRTRSYAVHPGNLQ